MPNTRGGTQAALPPTKARGTRLGIRTCKQGPRHEGPAGGTAILQTKEARVVLPTLASLLPCDCQLRLHRRCNWAWRCAGGGWPEQACRSAICLSRAPYEPSVGVQLLAALRAMFTKNRTEITSEQAVQELVADPDSPWHEYRGRGPITKNQVAALLRDFDIRPVVLHPTKRADFSRHGYRAAQFDDAFARFLPDEPNIRTLKREGM